MSQEDPRSELTCREIVKALEGIEKAKEIDPGDAKRWLEYLREVLRQIEQERTIVPPERPRIWIFYRCKTVVAK